MRRILLILQESVFVRNSFILFGGTMAMNVLNYAFHFTLGRIVDAETYGAVQSLIALLAIVSVPAAALSMLATKYGAVGKARGDHGFGSQLFSYLNGRIFKYGWPLVVGGILLTPFVQAFLRIEDTFAVSLLWILAALTFFSSASLGLLTGWQRFGTINATNVIGASVKFFLGSMLAWFGFGLDGIIFALVVAGLAGYLISVRGVRRLGKTPAHAQANHPVTSVPMDFSSIRGYVMTALVGTLGLVALGNVDIVLAKHILTAEEAGAYGALAVVAKVIFFVTGVISMVLFAMSSEAVEKNKHQSQSFFVFWVALGLTSAAAVLAILLYFLAPEFVLRIFFGEKYLVAAPLLGWFGLAAGLYAVVNLMLQQLLSMDIIRAAQWILGIAVLEAIGIFALGKDIYSIVTLVITAQGLALLGSLVFIWNRCKIAK